MSETGRYSGSLSDLYLEGKVWELVSEFFESQAAERGHRGKAAFPELTEPW